MRSEPGDTLSTSAQFLSSEERWKTVRSARGADDGDGKSCALVMPEVTTRQRKRLSARPEARTWKRSMASTHGREASTHTTQSEASTHTTHTRRGGCQQLSQQEREFTMHAQVLRIIYGYRQNRQIESEPIEKALCYGTTIFRTCKFKFKF